VNSTAPNAKHLNLKPSGAGVSAGAKKTWNATERAIARKSQSLSKQSRFFGGGFVD